MSEFAAGTPDALTAAADVQALAFHDSKGRIRHMHHAIVLEGGAPIDVEAMREEAIEDAAALGNNIRKLQVLHIREPFDHRRPYRVDVKKGRLIPLEQPFDARPKEVKKKGKKDRKK